MRYVLEGSVRKAGNKVRINGQLIDAATGNHLWADRFDGNLDDIFELQDKVASSVIGGIAPSLEFAEIGRAKRKTGNLQAYDYLLRCRANLYRMKSEANREALLQARDAVALILISPSVTRSSHLHATKPRLSVGWRFRPRK